MKKLITKLGSDNYVACIGNLSPATLDKWHVFNIQGVSEFPLQTSRGHRTYLNKQWTGEIFGHRRFRSAVGALEDVSAKFQNVIKPRQIVRFFAVCGKIILFI